MPLKLEGNLIDKFGSRWPTPIIETIEVYDNKLSVTISVYLEINEEANEFILAKSFNRGLAGIKIYCFYVLGDHDAEELIKKKRYKIFDELANPEAEMYLRTDGLPFLLVEPADYKTIAEYLTAVDIALNGTSVGDLSKHQYWLEMQESNYFVVDLAEMTRSPEEFYSEEGNPIHQYGITKEIPITAYDSQLNLADGVDNIFTALTSQLDSMTVFAFSSPLSYQAATVDTQWTLATSGPWQADWEIATLKSGEFLRYKTTTSPILSRPLYINEFSDISYDKVFTNGLINNIADQTYTTVNGEIFPGTPIRSIQGVYHTDGGITLETIEESMLSLNNRWLAPAAGNRNIQSVVDSVAYIVETYKESPNLLFELNRYRKAFPVKSGGGSLAEYYTQFRQLIIDSNTAVKRGEIVSSKEIRNIKIIDRRTRIALSQEPIDLPVYNRATDFVYGDRTLVTHNLFLDQSTNEYKGQLYGFFFFDLEKAYRTQSAIAHIFSYDKIIELFGPDIFKRYYYLDTVSQALFTNQDPEVVVHARLPSPFDLTHIGNLNTYFVAPDSLASYWPEISRVARELPVEESNDYVVQSRNSADLNGDGDSEEDAYLVLRNFDVPSYNPLLNRYNIACFEFQHLYKYFSDLDIGGDMKALSQLLLKEEVTCIDNTAVLYTDIADTYANVFQGSWEEYYNYAIEYCTYNSFTEKFNSFFSNAMRETFTGTNKPWAEMPLLLCLHQDLLFDRFGGDIVKIKEAATTTSEQINPETGTLKSLKLFHEEAQELWDGFYADQEGSLMHTLEAYGNNPVHTYGPVMYSPVTSPDILVVTATGEIVELGDQPIAVARVGSVNSTMNEWDWASSNSADWPSNIFEYASSVEKGALWTNIDLDAQGPIMMTAEEWRTAVRQECANLQNGFVGSLEKLGTCAGSVSTSLTMRDQPNYKDIRGWIVSKISHLCEKARQGATLVEMMSTTSSGYGGDLSSLLAQINGTGTEWVYSSNNTSANCGQEPVGYSDSGAMMNPGVFPIAGTIQKIVSSSGSNWLPFYKFALRRIILYIWSWYNYPANTTSDEWTDDPTGYLFDPVIVGTGGQGRMETGTGPVPAQIYGSSGAMRYPSLEVAQALWALSNPDSLGLDPSGQAWYFGEGPSN